MNVNKRMAALLAVALALVVGCLPLSGCLGSPDGVSGATASGAAASGAAASGGTTSSGAGAATTASVTEDGTYTSKEEVSLYIHTFGHLPSNFITKTKAKEAGWVSSKGNLDEVCPGKSIGGSKFYDDDGALPDARGRTWKECDVNYHGGFRGQERIVFSSDGLVYYTPDHYQTFEQLY
jgi:hypothetical protein